MLFPKYRVPHFFHFFHFFFFGVLGNLLLLLLLLLLFISLGALGVRGLPTPVNAHDPDVLMHKHHFPVDCPLYIIP